LLFLSQGAVAITVVDDLGRVVELKAPARRIVTLAPFLTELVHAVGAGDRVVGVSAHSDYPESAKKLPTVATAAGLDIERLVALRPELALAWRDSIRPEDMERLRGFGIAVYVTHARRLSDIPRMVRAIGSFTGQEVDSTIGDFEARVSALRRTYGGKSRVGVFLEIWHRPLTTISGAHFMNDALETCGGENAFKDLPGVAPEVPWETVYRRNPAVIVGVNSAANEREFQANWMRHGTLDAVREGRLLFVAADALARPTLRTPDAIARLCTGLDAMRIRLLVPRS
jgi:iron complex transport system substrate-binding protein